MKHAATPLCACQTCINIRIEKSNKALKPKERLRKQLKLKREAKRYLYKEFVKEYENAEAVLSKTEKELKDAQKCITGLKELAKGLQGA